MGEKWIESNLTVNQLSLWDENARFPDKYFNKSQKELVEYFCTKKDFKILDLAENIVKEFDLPQLEKIVVYDFKGRKIVLEGNRRLAVYKLLDNPDLLDNGDLKNKFLNLRSKINLDRKFKLACLVTKDKEQGFRYIERKHLRGNNEVSWGDNERAHHSARRGTANQKDLLKVEITKIIKSLDFPEILKEKVLGPGFVTTLWRLLELSPAWSFFGYSFDDNGSLGVLDKDFDEKLKVIIIDVLQKRKYNNKLFSRLTVDEIDSYLKQISEKDYERIASEIEEQTSEDLFGGKNVDAVGIQNNGKKSKPSSVSRKHLIPQTCVLVIVEPKINNVYNELKNRLLIDDSVKSVPNAVGVLFRVFLEISIDYFWEKEVGPFGDNEKIPSKITKVSQYMEDSRIATTRQLKNIRTVGSGNNTLLAIENFHNYVHSYNTQPSSSDLKLKWDNLEEFFVILWEYLNKQKK